MHYNAESIESGHIDSLFADQKQGEVWLVEMSRRLKNTMPVQAYREDFLISVHFEANRASLDSQLVLSLVDVLSQFKKYAVSSEGARGYMQVMPFGLRQLVHQTIMSILFINLFSHSYSMVN